MFVSLQAVLLRKSSRRMVHPPALAASSCLQRTGPAKLSCRAGEVVFAFFGRPCQESGGGILYNISTEEIYKAVSDSSCRSKLPENYEMFGRHYYAGWAAPVRLVHDKNWILQGYVMARAAGRSLNSYEGSGVSDFPFVEVLGKTVFHMQNAVAAGGCPFVEHAGNVMVEILPGLRLQ